MRLISKTITSDPAALSGDYKAEIMSAQVTSKAHNDEVEIGIRDSSKHSEEDLVKNLKSSSLSV